ncbi:MAG: hypothetical protein Q4G33_12050 [bacterium]|nr:hypothetical protein [bacterium]
MLRSFAKEVYGKGFILAMRALPIIIPVLLILHTNSTASTMNGQPTPPDSIKKYRKF